MKRSVAVETEENDSSTETESLLAHTPRRMSDPEIETSSSEAVTSEDVERQIRAVTDPLTQQLAHLCESMKELRMLMRTDATKRPPFHEPLVRPMVARSGLTISLEDPLGLLLPRDNLLWPICGRSISYL